MSNTAPRYDVGHRRGLARHSSHRIEKMFAATHSIANARALMRPNSAPRTTTPRSRGVVKVRLMTTTTRALDGRAQDGELRV